MRLPSLSLIPLALVASVAAPAAAPSGRDRGPGVAGERQGNTIRYRVGGFDGLRVGTAGQVDVRIGPAFSVEISGPAAVLDNVRVVRVGNGLEIGRRYEGRMWTADDRALRIAVTLPRLADFAMGGTGAATIDRIEGGDFKGALGGSGSLTIGRLTVGKADMALGGSGRIVAAGNADRLKLGVGGSGEFDGRNLRAKDAEVSVGGSGKVFAAVDGTASVSVAGSGVVDLGPQARCKISRVGSAKVRCGG